MDKLGPYELNTAILGDCLEVMRPIPDNSIDSIVTDSPYGLGDDPDILELLTHWLNDKDYDTGPGFMSRAWDVVPGPAVWRECYRVLKPGGCLMAFGGTRTCDLLSIAIRLAGFQRFDQIEWLYGAGFPKSLNVSKKLDEMAGAEREVVGTVRAGFGKRNGVKDSEGGIFLNSLPEELKQVPMTIPTTEDAKLFDGYGTALKPAHEVILCFWKPREKTFAHNALKWGVSGLNIDECRIPTNGEVFGGGEKMSSSGDTLGAYGHYESDGFKVNTQGRYPANVLLSHHESCVRVGVKRVRSNERPNCEGRVYGQNSQVYGKYNDIDYKVRRADPDGLESVPDYRCHPDCPVWQLDRQAGVRRSSHGGGNRRNGTSLYEGGLRGDDGGKSQQYYDSGSASRFYYCPKAPPREKWFYCEICDDVYPYAQRDDHGHGKPKGQRKHQIAHPTVKPLEICKYTLGVLEYLCRLTKTPTGGVILDPFGGSGTTALAAIANGRPFLLIENDPIYHRIAEKRIKEAISEPRQLELWEE